MHTQTDQIANPGSKIKESSPVELIKMAKRIHAKIYEGTITGREVQELSLIREQFKKLTGRLLTAKELRYH